MLHYSTTPALTACSATKVSKEYAIEHDGYADMLEVVDTTSVISLVECPDCLGRIADRAVWRLRQLLNAQPDAKAQATATHQN